MMLVTIRTIVVKLSVVIVVSLLVICVVWHRSIGVWVTACMAKGYNC